MVNNTDEKYKNGMMMRFAKLIIVMLAFLLVGCAKKDEKTMIAEAEKKLFANDIAGAIEEYNKFLEEYPAGQNTAKVLFEMGKIYQSKLDKNVEGEASSIKAIEYYKQAYEKFSASKEAPMALFMTGFIYADDLKKYDEAKEAYRLFIAKYPTHELADDAKAEIETVGMSPEEVILRKQLAGK